MLPSFLFYVSFLWQFMASCNNHFLWWLVPRIVVTTFIILVSQAKLCTKMRQIPPFSNNDAILACTLIFCPSLIWLSIVGLLLAITVYIISNINILIALAKGYSHRCCYGQYLSKLFPYYLATILPAYKLRRTTAYLNIWQGYSLFSIMGMLDFEHTDCVQCLCGPPDCTDFIEYSKLPFWFAFLVC